MIVAKQYITYIFNNACNLSTLGKFVWHLLTHQVLGPSLLPRHQFGHSSEHQQKTNDIFVKLTFSNIVLKLCYYKIVII